MTYEMYRTEQVKKMLKENEYIEKPTYGHLINMLEALHLPTVASWCWKDLCITCEEDLKIPLV